MIRICPFGLHRSKQTANHGLGRHVLVFEHGIIGEFNRPQNTTGEIRGRGKAELKRNTEPRTKGREEGIASVSIEGRFVPHSGASGKAEEIVIGERSILIRRLTNDANVVNTNRPF